MLDLSPEKIFVLGILALVVLGPNRLPQAARSLGRIIGQLRIMSSSFQTEVRDALGEPGEAITSALGEFRPTDIRRSVRQTITSTLAPPVAGATVTQPTPAPAAPAVHPVTPDDPSFN